VKFVQACLETDMGRYGNQDSIGMDSTIDDLFKDHTFPAKINIGISGCPRSCGNSHTRDFGIMGTIQDWTVFFGGNSGTRPRFGDIVAKNLATVKCWILSTGCPAFTEAKQNHMSGQCGKRNRSAREP